MKILIISYEYPPIGGGVGTSLVYYLQELREKDIEVDVIVPCDITEYDAFHFSDNITLWPILIAKKKRYEWTKGEMIRWVLGIGLETFMHVKRYDIIHYWGPYPAVYMPLHKNSKTPYVITFHGADVPGRHARFNRIFKLSLGYKHFCRKAKVITAVTDTLALNAEEWLNKNVEYIPNGIKNHKEKTKQSKSKLVTMCRLVEFKRIHILINAMKFLPITYTLDIYGDGPLMNQLRNLADYIGLGRIVFKGWLSGVNILLPKYKIYVQAAQDLGVSNISELDAIGYGLPVVRVESIGTEDFAGAVVPTQSVKPACFAQKISDVNFSWKYHHEKTLEISERFSWANVAKEYLKAYEKARS